jgi:Trp operon repressor
MNGLMLSQFLSLISRDGSKSTISARINMHIARQIRQDERLAKEVAQEYGVSISTIRHIRKNIMYVDHQNPWSQLL